MKNYFEEIGAWPRSHNIARSYVAGFVLSLILTLIAYGVVVSHAFPVTLLVTTIAAAAMLQFATQLYCFLHLSADKESRERWIGLGFAALIVAILVAGSLWIMFSLNGRMQPDGSQMEHYMSNEGGF